MAEEPIDPPEGIDGVIDLRGAFEVEEEFDAHVPDLTEEEIRLLNEDKERIIIDEFYNWRDDKNIDLGYYRILQESLNDYLTTLLKNDLLMV